MSTVNELAEAAARSSERYAAIRDRGHAGLTSLATARKGLADAEHARDAAHAALQALADSHLAGTPASDKAISTAILAAENASRAIVWAEALVAAGQRNLTSLQVELRDAETASMEASETSRRAALRARVLELAHS